MALAGPGGRGHLVGSKVATGKMVGRWSEAGGRGVPGPVLSEHRGRRETFAVLPSALPVIYIQYYDSVSHILPIYPLPYFSPLVTINLFSTSVFSIDGSFAASVSIMGSDPKVRAGAVDVVR